MISTCSSQARFSWRWSPRATLAVFHWSACRHLWPRQVKNPIYVFMQLFTKIVSKIKYTYKDVWDFFYRFGCLGNHAVDIWWHVPRQHPGYIRICYLCQMSYLYEDYKDLYMYIIKKSPLFFYITVIQNWHCQIWIFNPFASMVFVS